jgi:hypothetical protein
VGYEVFSVYQNVNGETILVEEVEIDVSSENVFLDYCLSGEGNDVLLDSDNNE